MSVRSDSCPTSENVDSVGALNSNRPQRLSLIRRQKPLSSPSPRCHTPAPLQHLTSLTTATSSPPSKHHDYCNDRTKQSSIPRKRGNAAPPSARGGTLGKAPASHAPSAGKGAAAAASPPETSRETGVASYARTNTATSSFSRGSFSLTRMRPSSAAFTATAARSATPHAHPRSSSRSASRTVPGFLRSTFSSRAHLSLSSPELPAADAALAPLSVSVADATFSNHSVDTERASQPSKGLRPITIERGPKMGSMGNNGTIRPGRTQTSHPDPPTGTPAAPAVVQGICDREYGGVSGVRTAMDTPPALLDGATVPPLSHPSPLTDPAPHIYGGKRRNRVTLESSFAGVSEGVDAEPTSAPTLPPPPTSIRSSAQPVEEQLDIIADAIEEPHTSLTLDDVSSQPHCTQLQQPQQPQKQLMRARNPSQSIVARSSAPRTPRRPILAPEARDCCLATPDSSQLNEKSQISGLGEETVCTAICSSLPAAPCITPICEVPPVPISLLQSPEYAMVNPHPAQPLPTPFTSSAETGPPSSTAPPAAAAVDSTEPQPIKRPPRCSASCTPKRCSSLDHCLLALPVSPSSDTAVHYPVSAPEQLLSKESIRSSSSETKASANLSQPVPSVPRSSSASAVDLPSPVGSAAQLTDYTNGVDNDVEEEAPLVRSTPPQPTPIESRELQIAAGSAVSAPSERSLSSNRSRSRSAPLESFAALLENLHELWQKEEEPLTCEVLHASQASNGTLDGCTLRGSVRGMPEPQDDELGSLMYAVDTDDHSQEMLEEAEEVPKGSLDGPLRGTDTTGHAPITPRLRRRIEKDQQRELEILRAITKECHPEMLGLLDSPETLMRELGRMDADGDGHEDGERDTTYNATDEGEVPPAARTSQKRPVALPSSSRTSPASLAVQSGRAKPEGRLPVRDAGRAAALTAERHGPTECSVRKRKPSVSATTPLAARARERSRVVVRSSRQTSAPEDGSAGNDDGMSTSTPRRRAAGEPGSGARVTGIPPCHPLGGAAPPLSTSALSNQVTAGAPGTTGCIRDSGRRPFVSCTMTSGGSEQMPRSTARRGDGFSGSSGTGTSPSQKAAAATSDELLPELFSAQEAANTITIVFDLDETLCNNRCFTGPIIRPGAELLLHTLRGLCPSPRYKFIDTHTRSQHASSRLYDEAMHRMGVAPLYRSRVAQRQLEDGYRRTSSTAPVGTVGASGADATGVSGTTSSAGLCSTGEARPATEADTNPLRLELVLWTASEESLARRAVRHMDPANKIFDEAIYRDARWYRDSHYTKELCRLGRCMNRVVIVENSIDSVIRNRQNAILVTSFVRNRLDRQLFLVREVLRDWVCGMKASLAEQLYTSHASSSPPESVERAADRHATLRAFREDSAGSSVREAVEEGGESPVPPHSKRPAARSGTSEGMQVIADHAGTPIREGNTTDNISDDNGSRRGASPELTSTAPCHLSTNAASVFRSLSRPTPRPLSAMARRAPNIVEFLQHHRLIFPDSNFLRFQLTGEVMKHLQTKEATLIDSALPLPLVAAEQADARVVRGIGCGPVSSTTRPTRAPPSVLPSTTLPVTAAAPTTANSTEPTPRASQSRAAGRACLNGSAVAIDSGAATATRLHTPRREVGTVKVPAAAANPISLSGGSTVYTTGNNRASYSSFNGMTRDANAHRDPMRLRRTASTLSKRPVSNEM
ncbi:hypothetical protein, conserved [Leishmania tarentolae]|uniref:FCP1 homology domain-containing protein n=1 Tax=Leishmania tarentolae TaxID=5689 RepID=A0A640KR04_LEITA|nr:hypothetical protein, conserved [Leishmania tarentolae]